MTARTRIEEALGLAPGSIGTTEKVQVACAALIAGRPADQVRLEELFGLDFGALAASAPPLTCPAPLKAPMLAPLMPRCLADRLRPSKTRPIWRGC